MFIAKPSYPQAWKWTNYSNQIWWLTLAEELCAKKATSMLRVSTALWPTPMLASASNTASPPTRIKKALPIVSKRAKIPLICPRIRIIWTRLDSRTPYSVRIWAMPKCPSIPRDPRKSTISTTKTCWNCFRTTTTMVSRAATIQAWHSVWGWVPSKKVTWETRHPWAQRMGYPGDRRAGDWLIRVTCKSMDCLEKKKVVGVMMMTMCPRTSEEEARTLMDPSLLLRKVVRSLG